MRFRLAAAPTAALLLVLVGCSSSSAPAASSPAATAGTPTVSGAFGTVPKVALPSGVPPTTLQTTVLTKGTGPVVAKGDLLVADYLGELWRDGSVFDSSFKRGAPASFTIGTGQVITGWDKALVGQPAGSRVLLVIPPADGYGSSGNPQGGIKGDDTLVFVVDVRGSFAATASAKGAAAPAPASTLPQVGAADGAPTITIPTIAAPTALAAYDIVVGTGGTVRKGDLLLVQYVGKIWKGGKTFDSSWERGAPVGFPIGTGQVITGWDKTLVGKKVGSRVLLVIPANEGYGSKGQAGAGIKGDDTLVFAVDILGSFPAATPAK